MGRVVRRALLLAAVAGCQSVPPDPAPPPPAEPPVRPASRVAPAAEPPAPEDDPLSLAADCLGQGDLPAACRHLTAHVRRYPDQVVFRAQLAELLARQDRLPEAQAHFEAAAARAQDGPPVVRQELVHYHTRLMEIAQHRGDEYAEFLHRGVGLYLVAARLGERDGDPGDVERLMCKAVKALTAAQEKRPDDARAAWYLYRVWAHLDQPRPTAEALRRAAAAAPFSALTPAESRELALAGRAEVVLK
jgi:tetratricopeptide (TPR) repeat protein